MQKFPKLYDSSQEEIQPIDCIPDLTIILDNIRLHYIDGCLLNSGVKLQQVSNMSCGHLHDGDLRERCYMCYMSRGHLPLLKDKIKKLTIELLRKSK
jgi:hypothetical protein